MWRSRSWPSDLPEEAASLRRVEREARLLATLNHPNVGAIYGLEVIEGAPYLVLELVEGETLLERLGRGALPMPEVVMVGVQIADALQEAHRKGIVHRDFKPANVKLGDSGRVKVLDFGIAKPMVSPDDATRLAGIEPTTSPGTLLGTAPYMSPEQARGLPVDPRSDLWAFGCLLYEMLTGRRAFPGANASDVLAAVLRDEPDWSALPADTPRGVRRLLRRCLRKDPRDRLQDAGDARIELTEAAMEEPPLPAPTPPRFSRAALVAAGSRGDRTRLRRSSPGAASAAGRSEARGVTRLSLDLPAGQRLAEEFPAPFAFAPDGKALAVVAREGETAGDLRARALGPRAPAHRGHRGSVAAHVRARRPVARLLRRPQAEAGTACGRCRPRHRRDRGQPSRGELGGGRHDRGRPAARPPVSSASPRRGGRSSP